jgi:hypothetical protein
MFEVAFGLGIGVLLGYIYRSLAQDRLPAGPGGIVARLDDWHVEEASDVMLTAADVKHVMLSFRNLEETIDELSRRVQSTELARVAAVQVAAKLTIELQAARSNSTSTVTVSGVTLRPITGTVAAPAPKPPAKPKAAPKPKAKAPAKARKR